MNGLTEYLITIGGTYQNKGQRDFTTAMISYVSDIPDEWEEFEMQADALERLFEDKNIDDEVRSTFVMNCYRAVPNKRTREAPASPQKPKVGNDWMKDFRFDVWYEEDQHTHLLLYCMKCGKKFEKDKELYEFNKWSFEHRKVCEKK
jgi:hypothetical protein